MILHIDKLTGQRLTENGVSYPGNPPSDLIPARSSVNVLVRFHAGESGPPTLLDAGSYLYYDCKPKQKYNLPFTLSLTSFTAPVDPATGYYQGTLDTTTDEAIALLNPNNLDGSHADASEPDTVPLMTQLTWKAPSAAIPSKSQKWNVTLDNSVRNGAESINSSANPPYPSAAAVTPAPRIARVESTGNNDSASVGGAPFATAQAAYNAILVELAAHPTLSYLLYLGIGVGWTIALHPTTGLPIRIGMSGAGLGVCAVNITGAGSDAAEDSGASGGVAPPVDLVASPDFALSLSLRGGNAGYGSGSGNGGAVSTCNIRGAAIKTLTVTGGSGGEAAGNGGNVLARLYDCVPAAAGSAASISVSGGFCSSDTNVAGATNFHAYRIHCGALTLAGGENAGDPDAAGVLNADLLNATVETTVTLYGGGSSASTFTGGAILSTLTGAFTGSGSTITLVKTAVQDIGFDGDLTIYTP